MDKDGAPPPAVTPAHTTQAISSGNAPPSKSSSTDMEALLAQFDPLSVREEEEQPPTPPPKEYSQEKEKPEEHVKENVEENGEEDNPPPVPEDKPFDFNRFLQQLRQKSAHPIARYLKSFLNEFSKKNWTCGEQVKIITDFKEFIAAKMGRCQPFSNQSDTELDNALEGMEKLIMNRLYMQTFSPEVPLEKRSDDHEEDVIRDGVLQEKMRIWHWIEGRHLDITDRFLRNGEAFVKLASDELLKINHYRAPRDKIICILNCCKVIFGLLRQTNSEESADGFLPILIYVVIKAQPEELISNVNYIQRFRNPDKLSGESGYYLSSLIGAISFVETLDRSQLSITDKEFEDNVESSVQKIAESKPAVRPPPHTPARHYSPDTAVMTAAGGVGTSGMSASQVLVGSAGLLSTPLKSLGKLFETDEEEEVVEGPEREMTPQESAARQASAEEDEARRIHEEEFESVCETLDQMFPVLDREIIQDVLMEKNGRVGQAVDACLALVGN